MDKFISQTERMIQRWKTGYFPPRREVSVDQISEVRSDREEKFLAGKTIVEPERRVPVLDECDVLVVGGGPAGLAAALAAARAGADTMLLDRYGCFGGVITTVGMETLAWYRYEGTVDAEGIGVEMERLAARMGGTIKWPYNDSHCLDADFFKIVADHLISESGVRPLLHCLATDAIMEGDCIKGILTESKSGRQAILAHRIIDCTGDADIAFYAGARYYKNPREHMLGLTTVFSCAGVNKERFLQYTEEKSATYADWGKSWKQSTSGKENDLRSPYMESEFDQARKDGLIPRHIDTIAGSWSSLSEAGEATNLNLIYLKDYDCTDVRELTFAEIEGRQQALHAIRALKGYVPGFEKAKLRNFGMTIGVRDSRKIAGTTYLTGKDVMNEAKFPDSIGIFPEFIDGYNVLILPTTGRFFEVPLGCMIPEKINNLLVAGRCVSGDRISHAAMRNMMACTVTGQGAGVAAAVSLTQGKAPRETDIRLIQKELAEQGVRIH